MYYIPIRENSQKMRQREKISTQTLIKVRYDRLSRCNHLKVDKGDL